MRSSTRSPSSSPTAPTSPPAASTTRGSRCSPGTPRAAAPSPPSSPGRTSARRRSSTGSPPMGAPRRSSGSAGCPSTRTSRPGSWPGSWSATRRWPGRWMPARRGSARSTPSYATGSAPGLRPIPRRRREPSSGPPSGTRRCSRSSACRSSRCPRSWTRRGISGRSDTTRGPLICRFGPASSTSRRRWRGPGAWSPAASRRPTAPGCSCSPTPASTRPPRATCWQRLRGP